VIATESTPPERAIVRVLGNGKSRLIIYTL